jgi:hypothetical protein
MPKYIQIENLSWNAGKLTLTGREANTANSEYLKQSIFDSIEEDLLELNNEIKLSIVEMTEEEASALPEFDGW